MRFSSSCKIELAVRIGEENIVVARGENAALEGGAVTAVIDVMNGADFWILFGQFIADRGSGIAAAVVDQDDLPGLGQFRKHQPSCFDRVSDIGLFVKSRKDHRKRDGGCGVMRTRSARILLCSK